jgi:hypothetical protein
MGYYYDRITERWVPRDHDRKITPGVRRVLDRRANLIEDLITEINAPANSDAILYASLLARSLVASDEILMKEFGEEIVRLTDPGADKKAAA